MFRRIVTAAALFAAVFTGTEAASVKTMLQPGFPNENDSLRVQVWYWSSAGTALLDSAIDNSGDTIRVTLSYTPTCGGESDPCQPGVELKRQTVTIGRLPPGRHTLIVTVRTVRIVFCNNPPCDPYPVDSLTDTTLFDVAETSRKVPVLLGFHYLTGPEKAGGSPAPGKMYRYTNDDTLFIALMHTTGCCTRYDPYLTVCGDTLVVMLGDTGEPCDCGSRQACATAVIANAPADLRAARIERYGEMRYSNGAFSATTVALDTSAPSVCINMKDTVSEGYRLFVDSSWTSYEMVVPSLAHADCLRLQPGSGPHVGSTIHLLYLDSIVSTDGLIEEFDREDLALWRVNTSWNGILLQPKRCATSTGHLLELGYADLSDQGNTTSMHRKRTPDESFVSTTQPIRIFIKASCRRPDGTGTGRRRATCPQLPTTGPQGIRLVIDARGRVVSGSEKHSSETMFPADGVYFRLRRRAATPLLRIGK